MRFPVLAASVAVLVLCGAACKRRDRVRLEQTDEQAPQLASVVHVADPRNASQLVSGFYDIEQNSWRWTAGKFAVLLRPPRTAARKGAVLELKFSVPEAVLSTLKTISLSATVNGAPLTPETYTQPGQFTYSRDLSPSLLAGDSVKVDFALDKTLPPRGADQRELGVIVSSVGLTPK
ncbi:MAG TPA: hypothetical protein VFA33_02625 [Bryobacteraceae bacterium]|nr:hypothetical protein [Bryobacteraceae bacterium]